MKPYVPSGKAEDGALSLLLLTAVVTALAVGGVANLIGQYFRLLIVFPMVMGLLTGLAVARVSDMRKVRMPALVVGLGLAAGLLCWSSDFGFDYLRARAAVRHQIEGFAQDVEFQGLGQPDDDAIERCVDITLVHWGEGREMSPTQVVANLLNEPFADEAGTTFEPEPDPSPLQAFAGHLRSVADEGMTISSAGRSDGDNIGAVGTYLLWLLELLLAVGAAGFVTWEQARQPFCERCKTWFDKKERVVVVGPSAIGDQVVGAMEHVNAGLVARLLAPIDPKKPFIALGIRSCAKCSSGPKYVAVAKIHAKGNKTTRKNLRKGMVEAGSMDSILTAMARAAEEQAAQQGAS